MNMKIADILQRKGGEVYGVAPERLVTEAVREMVGHKIGALLVQDDGHMVGIITERDILHALSERNFDLSKLQVRDLMTKKMFIGSPDDDLIFVMGLMSKNRFRHMPVMEGDKLIGMISSRDVVSAALAAADLENRVLKHYIKYWPEEEADQAVPHQAP